MNDPPAPLMGAVNRSRLDAGEATTESLWVAFDPAFGPIPATLTISAKWDGTTHRVTNRYTVRRPSWAGALFTVELAREPADLVGLPPGADRQEFYTVEVGGDFETGAGSGSCTCRGFVLAGEARRACKHIAAVAFVVAAGMFSGGPANGDATQTDPRGPRPDGTENRRDRGAP